MTKRARWVDPPPGRSFPAESTSRPSPTELGVPATRRVAELCRRGRRAPRCRRGRRSQQCRGGWSAPWCRREQRSPRYARPSTGRRRRSATTRGVVHETGALHRRYQPVAPPAGGGWNAGTGRHQRPRLIEHRPHVDRRPVAPDDDHVDRRARRVGRGTVGWRHELGGLGPACSVRPFGFGRSHGVIPMIPEPLLHVDRSVALGQHDRPAGQCCVGRFETPSDPGSNQEPGRRPVTDPGMVPRTDRRPHQRLADLVEGHGEDPGIVDQRVRRHR